MILPLGNRLIKKILVIVTGPVRNTELTITEPLM